ncbi:MAG: hypothetical protein H6747_03475 [Deltaproteobacteria bacterium]|nr:hypothetical protein [Deltaproteobacteria bacterium]
MSAQAAASAGVAEAIGLASGLRDAFRLRILPADLPRWQAAVRRRGWACAVADEPVAASAGGRWESPAGAAPVVHVMVVARDAARCAELLQIEQQAAHVAGLRDAAAVAELLAAHETLGAAYGYPACCRRAFADAHLEVVAGLAPRAGDNLVAIARAAQRSRAFDARLDVLEPGLMQPQRSVLRHFPCRFDCPASIALADALRAAGAGAEDEAAARGTLVLHDGQLVRGRTLEQARAALDGVGVPHAPAGWSTSWSARFPLWLPFRERRPDLG